MGYNTKLRGNELEIINYITLRDDKRKKLQSIYQYVVKHTSLNGGQFIKTNKEFHDMYSRYHEKMKADTFRKLLDALTKAGLIIKSKFQNVNIFTVNRNAEFNPAVFLGDKMPTNVPTNVPTPNSAESVDMTEVEGNEQGTQLLNTKYNYINIINNTSHDENVADDDFKNSKAYKDACQRNNKDTLAPVQLMVIALEILKRNRRRSEKLKSMIRTKLMDKMHIVRKNAEKYVKVVVADCIAKYEIERELYAYTIAKNKNNYRASYNKSNAPSKANFTQRNYDYDKLERQLLGWDDSDDDCEI